MGNPERDDSSLDDALKAAFEGEAGESVLARIERATGRTSRVLLREPPGEHSPLLKVPAPGQDAAAKDDSRYQIVGEIARGGVGVVYKGRDKDLGRDVAIKVLRSEHRDRPEVFDRFIEEAQIGAQLQHPGIAPVYALGLQPDGRPYFTMKLIKGRTLSALLKEREDPGDARRRFLQIFEQACQTLAYAHARGVIHRDLKPSNIMVGSFGEVQVVDWGFGKVLGRADHNAQRLKERTVIATLRSAAKGSESITGSVMGTPAYMPPEQALGHVEELDEQSDVFSLGAILCEILTGEPPYTGAAKDLLVKAAQARLDDAHARLEQCGADRDLVALARRCLEPMRADRPENAGDVAKTIGAQLAAAEERARLAELDEAEERGRLSRARHHAQWERQRKHRTRLLAASLLVAVACGGGAYVASQVQRRARAAAAEPRVAQAMDEATHLRGQQRLGEALAAARKAHDLAMTGDVDEDLLARTAALVEETQRFVDAAEAEQARKDKERAFVDRLQDIRVGRGHDFAYVQMDAQYEAAFRERAIDLLALAPGDAADQLRASCPGVLVEMAAALDAWAYLRRTKPPLAGREWEGLTAIAKLIDPDRNQLRDAVMNAEPERLRDIAREALEQDLPVPTLALLGDTLRAAGDRQAALDFLHAVRLRHPDDFWVNLHLSTCIDDGPPEERGDSIRFTTVAVALRPRSAFAREMLGIVLHRNNRVDEAMAAYRDAIRLNPGAFVSYCELGVCLCKKKQFDAAIACFRESIRLNPNYASAHTNLGVTLTDTGSYDEAIASCREGVRLNPGSARAHSNLGAALTRKGLYDEAIASLREAIRLDPEEPTSHITLGEALAKRGLQDEAIAELREAIRLDPGDSRAHNNLGATLGQAGRTAQALAEFREAVRLDPGNWRAQANLGNTLIGTKEWDEAVAVCQDVIRLRPGDAGLRNLLGIALRGQGRLDEAIAAHREAIRIDPQDFSVHYSLATLLTDVLGRHDDAIAEFHEVIRLKPDYANAHDGLGLALGRLRRCDEAITAFREAIRLDPDNSRSHNNLGIAYSRLGRLDEAIDAYRTAIRLDPGRASAHDNLGRALLERGRFGEAAAAFREVTRLKPDPVAYVNLGVALGREGRLDEAIESYREATRLDPRYALAHLNLADALFSAGDADNAIASCQAAIRLEPENAKAHFMLGSGLLGARRLREAFPELETALRLDPAMCDTRYNLACATLREGAGPEERARALQWLCEELALLRKLAEADPVAMLPVIEHWKDDPDLAGVRDVSALPAAERPGWSALWREVDELVAELKEKR